MYSFNAQYRTSITFTRVYESLKGLVYGLNKYIELLTQSFCASLSNGSAWSLHAILTSSITQAVVGVLPSYGAICNSLFYPLRKENEIGPISFVNRNFAFCSQPFQESSVLSLYYFTFNYVK